MTDCVFCKIVRGELPAQKVYEDEEFLAFLDIRPISVGHTLLIPKPHTADFFDTQSSTLTSMILLAKQIARAAVAAAEAQGLNLGVNNGEAAGQEVSHFHLHIIPRQSRQERKSWSRTKYAMGEAEHIAKSIRELL